MKMPTFNWWTKKDLNEYDSPYTVAELGNITSIILDHMNLEGTPHITKVQEYMKEQTKMLEIKGYTSKGRLLQKREQFELHLKNAELKDIDTFNIGDNTEQ